ncbi:glyoxylase-like metal-dependent hydrolase (beta-lactamase superfamily II) [Rhodococcus rhodochrous J45]|uniref:Glyoxylase-like metal-dependent hydrolase (Beta-lactamase superfamily II) n=1 Tax=Rhodococcus rhodochrous J45 TaxID=935266 RepID=A0A562DKV9_RHORH|nr:N-acyl homoserine lactonase family protein [Rhodococcus rhodochrous]TWH10291.1 glyoxylase-like metal-dependent hydrolase (beta-lactamase superfamily II) [Rhodococcus rhodochrous J45]
MTQIAPYEVYALQYATRPTMASDKFYRHELYKEPDERFDTAYYFWLIRNPDRTIMVDCGYSAKAAASRSREIETDPVELMARLGVTPDDVDHVVLSHMHFDHIGNVGLFPNATFSMARAEYEFWTGPYGDRTCIGWAVRPDEVQAVVELEQTGRLDLVDSTTTELFPGISLTVVPGHTPGQIVTHVTTGNQEIILASDALHFYEEMRLDRPFQIFLDLVAMYESFDFLRELDARPSTTIVAGHDPEVMSMFAHAAEGCVDLTRQVRAQTEEQ